MTTLGRRLQAAALCMALGLSLAGPARAAEGSKFLAPGFTHLSKSAKLVVMPVDVELFELSMGGVTEPKADWTASAQEHMKLELSKKTGQLGLNTSHLSEAEADEFAEQVGLHTAVARSINLHHGLGGGWALPTKEGRLDWTMGDAMQSLQTKTGARYGLFFWVRDSYASAGRKAAMVGLALLGVGLGGGAQVGYASLVDLESGRVLWFNRLLRASGDLREPAAAAETIDVLMNGFPKIQ